MKKQTLWIRLLVLMLVLAMIGSAFAACSADDENNNANNQNNAKETGEGDETEEFIQDALDGVRFDDSIVKILVDKSYRAQVAPTEEESNGKPVREVIFKRNETVQDRLGIEIEWIISNGGGAAGAKDVLQEVETACQTDPYDAICVYNITPYTLAVNNLCANLYDEENYLDLTAPWWPSALLEETTVNNTLHAITESNDYGLLRNMMAMFFNVDMLEARGIESPYDLVEKNEWTIDKLATLIKDTYEDTNGKGDRDKDDIYGYINATDAKRDAWFFALGNRYAEVQDGEIISVVGDDHIQTFIDKMLEFYTDDTMLYDHEKQGGRGQNLMFLNQRACFYSTGVFTTEQLKEREVPFEYGVVPMPKMNSEQERYYTHLSNTYDTWCVSYNAKDQMLISAVLECMASESYRQIGPTYYDTYVKIRYASNEKLAPMYDLVRDSVTFDLIYLYSAVYPSGASPKAMVRNCVTNPSSYKWSSIYASNKTAWEASFAKIGEIFAN